MVRHAFVNPQSDGGDATVTRPTDWNADHVIPIPDLLQSYKSASDDPPDDEFNDASGMSGPVNGLDNKWTLVDGGSGTVSLLAGSGTGIYDLTTRPHWLLMQTGTASGDNVQLRQDYTLPDGKCITGYLSYALDQAGTASANNEINFGLCVNDNDTAYNAGAAGQTHYIMHDAEASGAFRILAFDGSSTLGEMPGSNVMVGGWFFRIDRSGLVYRSFASHDGWAWVYVGSKTMGTAANNVWIFCTTAGAATRIAVGIPWFRLGTALAMDPWPLSL